MGEQPEAEGVPPDNQDDRSHLIRMDQDYEHISVIIYQIPVCMRTGDITFMYYSVGKGFISQRTQGLKVAG